jgi:uncharacterized membrane protein YdjX (TVP38/TMEM64 family)
MPMIDKEPSSQTPGSRDGCGAPGGVSGLRGGPRSLPALLKRHVKRHGPLLAIAGAMIVVFGMGWHREVTLDNVVLLRNRFHHFLAGHQTLSLLVYCLSYICMTALSLPGGLVLTVSGGLLFGCLLGGTAAVISATAGATLLFLVARGALGETFTAKAGPWLGKLREGFRADALSYLLFLRLVPAFPFWLVNIAAAILGVPLKTYVVATFLGIIPATFAFAAAGAGLDSVIAAALTEHAACVARDGADACKLGIHAGSLITKELVLALALLGLVALIPVALRKWRNTDAAAK